MGGRSKGRPSITRSGRGQDLVMFRGVRKAPLPWLFGPHAAREQTQDIHTHTLHIVRLAVGATLGSCHSRAMHVVVRGVCAMVT